MATLAVISVTLVGGIGCFALVIGLFGCAVVKRSVFVSARCTARPQNVIYHPNPKHPCQDRGNTPLGWMAWVMNLTYDTMINGVPGTGTREDGLKGSLLKVNLDGIVILRFHHLGTRVGFLATVLFIAIILPLYKTAKCSEMRGDLETEECLNYNLTDYERLTLANIPYLEEPTHESLLKFFELEERAYLGRLYAVVCCVWIVTGYALHQLNLEWLDLLAMRRVYYLEADHWKDRQEEMQTLQEDAANDKEEDPLIANRSVWVPHPEQRDTVPNVELYSILVGGLPSLPTEAVEDVEAVFSRKESMDWQLSVTTAFFDHCVPNQPGFSSSVAAVTILPAANQLTDAWKQWYKAAAKLRRLRFIRRRIAHLRHKEAKTETTKDLEFGKLRDANVTPLRSRHNSVHDDNMLGSETDLEVENHLLHALDFGPEQTAVYSREFALGAANLAPHGWFEGRIRSASLEQLLIMENAAATAVQEANLELQEARERIADSCDGDNSLSRMFELDSNDSASSFLNDSSIERTNSSGRITNDSIGGITIDTARSPVPESPSKQLSIQERKQRLANLLKDRDSARTANTRSVKSLDCQSLASFDEDTEFNFDELEYHIPIDDGRGRKPFNRSDRHETGSVISSMSKDSTRSSGFLQGLFSNERKKVVSKAKLGSTQLPGALNLEAGLWNEQKRLSVGNSQQQPRASKAASRMSKASSVREPMRRRGSNDSHGSVFSMRSRDSIGTGRGERRVVVRRRKSSSSAGNLYELTPESKTSAKVEIRRVSSYDAGDILSTSHRSSDSIWETLVKEEERKTQLRAKLNTHRMSEVSNESMTKSPLPEKKPEEKDEALALKDYFPHLPNLWSQEPTGETAENKARDEAKSSAPSDSNLFNAAKEATRKREGSTTSPPSSQRLVDDIRTQTKREDQYETNGEKMDSINDSKGRQDQASSVSFRNLKPPATINPTLRNYVQESQKSLKSNTSSGSWVSLLDEEDEEGLRIAFNFEERAGLRRRDNVVVENASSDNKTEKWQKVMSIVLENSPDANNENVKKRMIASGRWKALSCQEIWHGISTQLFNCFYRVMFKMKPPDILDDFARDSTYAVVTFTSRQAAVAARHCLTDARGSDRWVNLSDLPSPPLADAPACNATSFRGCVRPVTLTISDTQKKIRHFIALVLLAIIYFFYTRPLTAATNLLSAENLANSYPEFKDLQATNPLIANVLLGFIPALIWISFFAICPPLFKLISNFGSNATSAVKAESSALKYFWWFMVLSAFTGTSFDSALVNGFADGITIGKEIQLLLESTAARIPKVVSASWLNWMIARMFVVLPSQYLLQMNTFLFTWLGLHCCARAVRGGGAGPPIPYRIYVDSGVVWLCLFALAPACPLIAPAAFMYFFISTPLLRWTLIFLYKPKFDIGGQRFPFIVDMCVSGMVVGQILLTTMMAQKKATGPAVAAAIPLVPTIFYRYRLRRRYLRAYKDAALLQTSLLDGWDVNDEMSDETREDFRRFLVDCHKAAYVPVCIASGDARALITAEPAVVIPLEGDFYDEDGSGGVVKEGVEVQISANQFDDASSPMPEPKIIVQAHMPQAPVEQPGRMMRRASLIGSPKPRKRASIQTKFPSAHNPTGERVSRRRGSVQMISQNVQNPNGQSQIAPVGAHQKGRMMRRASVGTRVQR